MLAAASESQYAHETDFFQAQTSWNWHELLYYLVIFSECIFLFKSKPTEFKDTVTLKV